MTKDFFSSTVSVERYLQEIGRYPLLNRDEERELAVKARAGNTEARLTLVQANLRLVVKISLEYAGLGLPLSDLIAEGNIGIMRAAELFDPSKEAKFSTYAALWVKQRMRRAITNQAKTIRVPIWKNQMLRRLNISTRQMALRLGRHPTEAELSSDSGFSTKEIRRLQDGAVQMMSLDAPVGREEDKDSTLGNLLPDENAAHPGEECHRAELLMETVASLNLLNDKELKIIAMRFGLGDKREQTLEAIGHRFKLSRERIRQLQESALEKLRRKFGNENDHLPENQRRAAARKVADRLKALFRTPDKSVAFLSGLEPLLNLFSSQAV